MLTNQINIAKQLGVQSTKEYEEANRKLKEIEIIEDKLEDARAEIKRDTKRLNCCICFTFILFLILGYLVISYGMFEPDMKLINQQKQAEKDILQYNYNMIE